MSSDTFHGERLHPAAIAIMGLSALRESALPLVVIAGLSAFRGGLETADLLRTLLLVVLGALLAVAAGAVTWANTRVSLSAQSLTLRAGWLSTKETTVPLERVQALDEIRGPLHRLFGVARLDVQTAGGAAGGEISLAAADAETAAMLRRAVAQRRHADVAPATEARGPRRRLATGSLLAAALTSGSLGVLLPVVAFVPQLVDGLFLSDRLTEDAGTLIGFVPDTAAQWLTAAALVLGAAWMLSAIGVIVAFAGFEAERLPDRIVVRRGLLQRRTATVPVARVQAVRVVEGVLRQPLGLAAVRVEVAGYAQEAAAAQTLFPLVRRREVAALVRELLPEMPHDLGPVVPAPRRALRRYLLVPLLVVAAATGALGAALGTPLPLLALLPVAALRVLAYRAAGLYADAGTVAIRFRRLARTTLLGPARLAQRHHVHQSWLQRRAALADFEITLGSGGNGRVRHLEARDAWAAFAAVSSA